MERLEKKIKLVSGESTVGEPLNAFGYRGLHLVAELDGGIKSEIQIHTPESWKLKEWSDPVYRKWRTVTDKEI